MKGWGRNDINLRYTDHPVAFADRLCGPWRGGLWWRDLGFFAFGKEVERQRRLIGQALGPVWEANHVWLIFLIVGLFTAFPPAFSILSTALFVPFTLAVIGIVLRGAAFIFRANSEAVTSKVWGRVVSTASTITPFFFGTAAAAVASGHVHFQVRPV